MTYDQVVACIGTSGEETSDTYITHYFNPSDGSRKRSRTDTAFIWRNPSGAYLQVGFDDGKVVGVKYGNDYPWSIMRMFYGDLPGRFNPNLIR